MKDTRTSREKQILVLEKVAEEMVKHLKTAVPPSGIFRPYGFRFEIYGTKNMGMMQVEYKSGQERMVQLGVFRKDTDRLFSHFLPSGTNAQLIAYFEEPANVEQWMESIRHLSEKADGYWK